MNKIFRYINQNRRAIRIALIFIIFIILLIYGILKIIDNYQKDSNNQAISKSSDNDYAESVNKSTTVNNNSVISNKSSVTGKRIESEKLSNDTNIIENFLNYCNDGDTAQAFDLVSDDCKEEMFSDIDAFVQNYFDPIFGQNSKLYTIENWNGSTYKVNISDNILATGNSENDNNFQDFITINGEKLNINNFISKQEINRQNEKDGIEVKVLNKLQYRDYTEYEIEVNNKSNSSIMIDDLKDINSMYIVDESDAHYSAYTNELSEDKLIVDSGDKTDIKIKYFCKYNSTRKMKELVFSRIVLDYNGNSINNYFEKIDVAIL